MIDPDTKCCTHHAYAWLFHTTWLPVNEPALVGNNSRACIDHYQGRWFCNQQRPQLNLIKFNITVFSESVIVPSLTELKTLHFLCPKVQH